MIAQLVKFIEKKYHIIIFILMCLVIVRFTLFEKGVWAYLDLSYEATNLFGNSLTFGDLFHSIYDYTFFGFDNTQLFSTRFINIFSEIAIMKLCGKFFQTVYFLIYFGASFFIAKKCLSLIFDENASRLAALLYAFNPVSLYFLNEAGFFFVYFSLPLVVYSFVAYFCTKGISYAHILLFSVGISLLTSYARISFIYFGIMVFVAFIYYRNVLHVIKRQKAKLLLLVGVSFLTFLPIVFSFIYPHINGDHAYFSGISNYSKSSVQFGGAFYEKQSSVNFSEGFIATEITTNYSSHWQQSDIFITISLVYFLGCFLWSMFIVRKQGVSLKEIRILLMFIVIFLVSIFLKMLAHFVTEDVFVKVTYTYLPFLANTSFWTMCGFMSASVGLVAFLFAHTARKERIILVFCTITYMILSTGALIFYGNNVKLAKIDKEQIPAVYDIFSQKNDYAAAVFFPDRSLYFNWAPYPIDISQSGFFKEIFTNNIRLANDKQAKLYENLYDQTSEKSLSNLYLFGGEDIFVFKDVKNDDVGFDYYPKKDYVQLSSVYYQKMKNENAFYLKEDNEHFAHFVSKNAAQSNFFIYSPATIINAEPSTFFAQNAFDAKSRILIVDARSYNKPKDLPSEGFAQNVKISQKYAQDNPVKYPIKIENRDKDKPFLLHMNQTFGGSWKLKWVDATYFDDYACTHEWKNFSLSHNATCLTVFGLADWRDLRLLLAPEVQSQHHFEGNFVGNSWVVSEQDVPENLRENSTLYAVVVYEKQLYFLWTMVFSLAIFIALSILTFWAYVRQRSFIKKKIVCKKLQKK